MSKTVTDQDFKSEVLDFQGVALIDFWATWCQPCLIQGPIVEKVAEKYAGNSTVKVLKLDVDSNPDTAGAYQVFSIPTMLLFKGGQVVETFVGVRAQDVLEQAIEKHIA